jgi:hypothetical protein
VPRVNAMSDSETASIVDLQTRLRARLEELHYNGKSSDNVAHHLAEISVLSRNFFDHTLPLFLSMSIDHRQSLAQLIVSIKCDLEELRDAMNDVEPDLLELMQYLNREDSAK